MSHDPTDLPINPTLRALAKTLHERYQVAARIARATWVAAETSPEAMVAATATLFIAMNDLLGPGSVNGGARAQEIPAVCPECGGAIYDNRQENVERRAKGLKPRPELKCRVCAWVQWPAKPAK